METITRKSLLYKSGIGVIGINYVQGCSHGCNYPCYAYMLAKSYERTKSYEDWCQPKIVANAAEILNKELAHKRNKPDSIHLCLSTDPFMYGYPEIIELTLELISIINSYNIKCIIRTKGTLAPELADTNLYSPDNIYGISLVSLNEEFRRKWEPGASSYSERINSLKYLHNCGLNTLVHIEPYPTPNIINQNLEEILEAVGFANNIYFSGWNYNNIVKQFPNYKQFYSEQARIVRSFCHEHHISYNS